MCLGIVHTKDYTSLYCTSSSRCGSKTVYCPEECPDSESTNSKSKVCRIDCDTPKCKSECKRIKPDCNNPGSACYDPRFIGGDGTVFYFHGKSNQHFSLVSDQNIQINARFIGHRPAGRTRDFTWIQALGLLFNSHTFSLEAIKSASEEKEPISGSNNQEAIDEIVEDVKGIKLEVQRQITLRFVMKF